MEDKERNKEEGWNKGDQDSEDFGLPNVSYNPLDKDEPTGSEEVHNEEIKERYYADYNENKGGQVVAVIVFFLVLAGIGIGVWYFFFRSQPDEQLTNLTEESFTQPAETETTPDDEFGSTESVEQQPEEPEAQPTEPATPQNGSLNVISSPGGRYYVVVGSFIDDDLARDLGNELNAKGTDAYLIEPYNNNKYYRLAIGNFDTWSQALDKSNELKNQFGNDVWVLKY